MSEPFTINDAVAAVVALDNPPAEAETVAPEAEAPVEQDAAEEVSGEVAEGDAPEAEAESDEPESEAEVEAAADPVDAPEWYDAEDKAKFAALSPEHQAMVRRNEDKREAVVQKVKQEAKAARETATAEATKAKELADRLAAAIPDERKRFDEYYADIDWQAYLAQDPIRAQQDYIAYDQGLKRFNELETQRAEAERIWRDNFTREESAKLKEMVPELAQDKALASSLVEYVTAKGISAEQLNIASAVELSIAYKAMQYDRLMAEATTAKAPPKTQPTPVKVPPKGAVQAKSTTQDQRQVQQIKNRFAQTASMEDAAKLINALGL